MSEVVDVNFGLLPDHHPKNEHQEAGPEAIGRPSVPVNWEEPLELDVKQRPSFPKVLG